MEHQKFMFHFGWMLTLVLMIHTLRNVFRMKRHVVFCKPTKRILMHILNSLSSTENWTTKALSASKKLQVIMIPGSFLYFNDLVYSEWTQYTSCSATCGEGTTTRTRTCIGGICSRATDADIFETSICNERGCE